MLTKNEKRVLYGLVKYPDLNDRELSSKINVKLSTLTSIKSRLYDKKLYHKLMTPLLNKLGCELLAIIYTQFNPVIPLEERVKTTKKTIEVFEEIFYSIGEQEKGFSISLSKDYTTIGRINEIRTETFGKVGLLESEYPEEVIFPFDTSNIIRFFDFSRLLKKFFSIENINDTTEKPKYFSKYKNKKISKREKKVFSAIVENPNATNQEIGEKVNLSRHTVSKMKKKFYKNHLLKKLTLPNLEKLGFEILAFYHIKFNPHRPPNNEEINYLDSFSTIFLARKKFEAVIISAYPTYDAYKKDKMNKIRFLKEKDIISYTPAVRKYRFKRMEVIKDFEFSPITKKILNIK